jgi:hypothetical protein
LKDESASVRQRLEASFAKIANATAKKPRRLSSKPSKLLMSSGMGQNRRFQRLKITPVDMLPLISAFLLLLPPNMVPAAAFLAAGDHMGATKVSSNVGPAWERISPDKCRRLLGGSASGISDAVLTQIRDQLYAVADCAVSLYSSDRAAEPEALALVGDEDRVAVIERAAIVEFDAGQSRSIATRVALAAYVREPRKGAGG